MLDKAEGCPSQQEEDDQEDEFIAKLLPLAISFQAVEI